MHCMAWHGIALHTLPLHCITYAHVTLHWAALHDITPHTHVLAFDGVSACVAEPRNFVFHS